MAVIKWCTRFVVVALLCPVWAWAQVAVDHEIGFPYYQRLKDGGGIREESHYVTMDDGVRLAVNVYRPSKLKKGENAPAILYMTRYWRAVGLRWPFKWFVKMVPSTANFNPLDLVRYGYVLVTVDVRGTGASEGDKTLTLPDMREVLDSKNLIDWVIKQPWSNGTVGAAGVSYIGNTALYALHNQHPALKAIAPTYSVWDLYDDVSAPGGVFYHNFINRYASFCEGLDKNELPASRRTLLARTASYGVQRVKGTGPKATRQIMAQHSCNVYHATEGSTAIFIDDTLTIDRNLYVRDVLSPHRMAKPIMQSNAAIYSWSGWRDAAFVHSAVRQFINLNNGKNMLRLGPWNHGGAWNISPNVGARSKFDDTKELVRFFDHHLGKRPNGLDTMPPVWYYTMVENKWKSTSQWPPTAVSQNFFFDAKGAISPLQPTQISAHTTCVIDTTRSLPMGSRWHMDGPEGPMGYETTTADDTRSILFTSAPLAADMEVTGHPLVELFIKSSKPDGSVFVYLEDVNAENKAWLVTDGQLRFVHRLTHPNAVHYNDCVPQLSYTRADARPMDTTKPEKLTFDLLPISYLFKKGHRIRVRLAGTDVHNFKMLWPEGGSMEVFHDSNHASRVVLPVVDL